MIKEGINTKTIYYPHGWVRIIDIIGMVISPISLSLPFFFWGLGFFLEASSKGNIYYKGALATFLGALGILIIFGPYFGRALKSYVNHQATRNDVRTFRVAYFGLILISLVIDFMIFASFLFGSKL